MTSYDFYCKFETTITFLKNPFNLSSANPQFFFFSKARNEKMKMCAIYNTTITLHKLVWVLVHLYIYSASILSLLVQCIATEPCVYLFLFLLELHFGM